MARASTPYDSLLAYYAEACLWFERAPAGTVQREAALAGAKVLWNRVAEETKLREMRAAARWRAAQ